VTLSKIDVCLQRDRKTVVFELVIVIVSILMYKKNDFGSILVSKKLTLCDARG
jgi:hypothetical protein